MLRTHATSEVTHKWFEYGLNTYQERGPRRDDFRQGDLRRSQERSKGGPGEVQRAAREDRTSAPGPKRGSKRATESPRKEHRRVPRGDPRGLDHCPKMLPREPWEVPPKGGRGSKRTPKPRPDRTPKKCPEKCPEEGRRGLRKSSKSGARMSPRGATRGPEEATTTASKRNPEKHYGPRRAPTGYQAAAQYGFKRGPRAVQDCVKVSPKMASKKAPQRPQEGSKRVSKIMQNGSKRSLKMA